MSSTITHIGGPFPIPITESNFILTKNLDFKSPFSYADSQRTDFGDLNKDGTTKPLIEEMQTGNGFPTIGSHHRFNKNFDGSNYEIRNLYINNTAGGGALFLQTNGGSIKNLGVSGKVTASGNAGGIICTPINNTQVDNCYNKCDVTGGGDYTGGIVGGGLREVIITNSYNLGNIESKHTEGRARRYSWYG